MSRSDRFLVAVAIAIGASLARPALAAPPIGPRAQAHYQAGYEAFKAGDYEAAIREFKQAQLLHPSPLLDYNLGAAYDKLDDAEPAVRYYRKYLDERPDAPNRKHVEERIAALAKAMEEQAAAKAPDEPPPVDEEEPEEAKPAKEPEPGKPVKEEPKPEPPKPEPPKPEPPKPPPPPPPPPKPTPPPPPAPTVKQYQPRPFESLFRVDCPDGQVPAKGGPSVACCWPGQRWSLAEGACVGAPLCPAGFVYDGASCARHRRRAGRTPVAFRPYESEDAVEIGVAGERCLAPCTLDLAPGEYDATYGGNPLTPRLRVKAHPMVVNVRRHHPRALIAGGIMLGAGAVAIVSGLLGITVTQRDDVGSKIGGGLLIVAGGGLFVTGGILALASGGDRLDEVERSATDAPERASRPQLLGIGLAPSRNGVAASLAFSF